MIPHIYRVAGLNWRLGPFSSLYFTILTNRWVIFQMYHRENGKTQLFQGRGEVILSTVSSQWWLTFLNFLTHSFQIWQNLSFQSTTNQKLSILQSRYWWHSNSHVKTVWIRPIRRLWATRLRSETQFRTRVRGPNVTNHEEYQKLNFDFLLIQFWSDYLQIAIKHSWRPAKPRKERDLKKFQLLHHLQAHQRG